MAGSAQLEDIETGKEFSQCRYFKPKLLGSHNAIEINETVEDYFDEKSIVLSDESTSYVDISNYVDLHVTEKSSETLTKETLRWVHIIISNAKKKLLGNYLQLYLNEFVYKLNRRHFGDQLFEMLVIANITGL